MPTWNTIALFLSTTLLLVMTPGPVVIYLMTCSVDRGRRAGLVAALGVGFGTLIHALAAAIGLSAILQSSALAFTVVQYAGAVYLIYLGIRTLLARPGVSHQPVLPVPSTKQMFVQGALINLLNPKTALFFFAWLPRFVHPDRGSVAGQIVFFGGLLMILGLWNDCMYVVLAGTARGWLKNHTRWLFIQHYLVGWIYVGLGITAALLRGAA